MIRLLLMLGLAVQAPQERNPATYAALRPHARDWEQLLAAEDARARSPAQLATLVRATRHREPEMRRLAVRALGRLERATLVDSIVPLLNDVSPAVRAEAAHALAQAVHRDSTVSVLAWLNSALATEPNAAAGAALAESLGRVRQHGQGATTLQTLLRLGARPGPTRLGAVRGLFFLARTSRASFNADARTTLLRIIEDRSSTTRTRTVAAAALAGAGLMDAATIEVVLRDPHPLVRREAAASLVALADTVAGHPLVLRALRDPAGMVRYDALRAYGRRHRARGCDPVLDAARDRSPHVRLQALDLLGAGCGPHPGVIMLLDSLAGALRPDRSGWHAAAHALVALARSSPAHARTRLPAAAAHPNLFVRTYAAAAAEILAEDSLLFRLARDGSPNVRTAAVEGLSRRLGHAADSVYVAQLEFDDSQLLMAAAGALAGSTQPAAADALLNALDRVTRLKSETSRDGRVALLRRLQQLGNASLAARLEPYLRDFDPQVAALAADILGAWTGRRPVPQPAEPPPLPLPRFEEMARLTRDRVRIDFADGQTVTLRLLPFDAPANAYRLYRLARAGRLNGLTLHRVAPNFVVQGGSPNANEYSGDAPYSRDELAAFNWRGTVGLSTRGRDTGDGQIYFNLIDNVRLDHDYTILAVVTQGLDVIDRLLEGAVMRRVYTVVGSP